MGIMEKNMKTTICYSGFRIYRVPIIASLTKCEEPMNLGITEGFQVRRVAFDCPTKGSLPGILDRPLLCK